ncbi:MAG TPA: response regulator [Rhodanobacteraceae bacterium]|nr:response regulator [Rhodanobacteraceae bacterium]
MNTPRLRAVLVDDEVLARLALRQALAAHADVEIVGECGNADEALQVIHKLEPDLLFLDIQMPGMDGFKLLQRLAPERAPLTVFVTAFGEHALHAFDADAVDYVLKPVDQVRFDQAMVRVKQRRPARTPRPADGVAATPFLQRISVRVGEHIRVIAVAEIDWIGADGNYVRIHTGQSSFLHRETLGNLAASLDPACFLRIHRGTLVNIERVREVHPLFQGNAEVVLLDGTRLNLSRRFRAGAHDALGLR